MSSSLNFYFFVFCLIGLIPFWISHVRKKEHIQNSKTTIHVTVLDKGHTPSGYGYASNDILFENSIDGSRIALSPPHNEARLLKVGDSGTLTYSTYKNENYFVSFILDKSPSL